MTTEIDPKLFADALKYYIDHIQIELSHNRADLLRHLVDPLCALSSGFIVRCQGTPRYEGNHSRFKTSMFDTIESRTEEKSHMEHVVPLLVIEEYLLTNRTSYVEPTQRKDLLALIQHLVVPCVVSKKQNVVLNEAHRKTMPKNWNNAPNWLAWDIWARYKHAEIKWHDRRTDKIMQASSEAQYIITSLTNELELGVAAG